MATSERDKRVFLSAFRLMDSPVDGEAEAAFKAARSILQRTGDRFVDLLDPGPKAIAAPTNRQSTPAPAKAKPLRVEIVVAGRGAQKGIISNAAARVKYLHAAHCPARQLQLRITEVKIGCHHHTDWSGEHCLKVAFSGEPRLRVRPALRQSAFNQSRHVLLFADDIEPGWLSWAWLRLLLRRHYVCLNAYPVHPASDITLVILNRLAAATGGQFRYIRNENEAGQVLYDT